MLIAIIIVPFSDASWSKLDVVPAGGGIARVGVALLIVLTTLFQPWLGHIYFA